SSSGARFRSARSPGECSRRRSAYARRSSSAPSARSRQFFRSSFPRSGHSRVSRSPKRTTSPSSPALSLPHRCLPHLMPELPELEAWRRALDAPVSAFPIAKAGPAHVATLKTFDPPLSALEGRRLSGAERRAKRLLFPTDDGELVVLVHLMTAGRLKYLEFGEKGPKTPAFRLVFEGGAQLVLTEAGARKRAGVWVLNAEEAAQELAHLGPDALGIGAERLAEICAVESRRLHSMLRDQRVIAGIGRAWANEILHHAKLSPYELTRDVTPGEVERLAEAIDAELTRGL